MSSDNESVASSQISAISSQAGKQSIKQHKSEQWEINLIGNFLLTLYHKNIITPQSEWNCKKNDIRKEFQQFVTPELRVRLKEVNGSDNIGNLLHRCGFLFNTPRGSSFYKLKSKSIFDFRNRKLTAQDKRTVNDDINLNTTAGPEDILQSLTEYRKILSLQVNYEIDEDSPVHPLQYEGTTMQQRRPNYHPTNMSCFICQQDFPTMDGYEEHIQTHNDEKEFEFLKELSRFDSSIFSLSYRLCKNSHHFCFTIECKTGSMVIEKIIIVQSRSMFYVHNMRVPYDMPENGKENFYVDSHLFAIFVEQPIVLISHLKDNKDTRIIEEHHFMRALEFPKVNFAIKPFRLPSAKTFSAKFKLPDYFPPLEIRDALRDDFIYEKLMKTSNEFRDYVRNGKILQPQTIGPTLTTLLHIEDMDAIKDYLNLLQHNVKLRCFGDNYSMRLRTNQRIHIENVLSLFDDVIITTRNDIKADSDNLIKLILQNKDDMKISDTYVGQIEDVNSGRVSFKCYKKLDLQRTYTIIFRPSRLQLRYQYRAMELLPVVMQFLKKFLFPGQLMPKSPSTLNLELYNKNIYNNPEQLQAVRNIAEGPRNDATYIIFGPPGTGKTTTLVESILQVLKRDGTKILVTASSNAACDEVALRLCQTLGSIDMARAIVRIYAQSNEARIDTIDDLLLEHSNMYSVHFYPDVDVLHQYRIVVCTMSVVAKLSTGKFGRLQNGGTLYTHLFIDEVAASTEVEALMAITSVLTPKSCLIIAGDHKQLGPIVKSKRADEFNLGVSLMDRLLERECYRVNTDTGDYDRTIQSRLRLNFRSHPAIVNLYSGMYYHHDLEAKANIDDVSLVKDWHMAPSKDFPIIFHSIDGKCYSDNQSFSLYNSNEINIVMDYVKDLMYFGINGKPVRECDVGIISPYKKQYLRIREELNLRKWYQIETGSVENFQGKEKQIIIVSFVRSGTSTLGFLESPRRLNVTLSRAKSLLILIGNASTLSINPDYDYIVKECQRHYTLIGKLHNPQESLLDANNDVKNQRRANNRYKPYNKDSSIETVSKTLKDLKLKNNNKNSSKVKKNNRRQRRGKKGGSDKDKENDNESSEDDDDAEEDGDDSDVNDVDNKPSTSKASGKPSPSQPTIKQNQPQTRDFGKNAKANKDNKQNTNKNNETSKTNLDAYFNELPSVPNLDTTIKPSAPPMNQVHPLMMLHVERPQNPIQHNYKQPNHYPFNVMQNQHPRMGMPPTQSNYNRGQPRQPHPQHQYGQYGPPQMGSLMGMPPMQPNYNMGHSHQQLQWQAAAVQQHQYLQQQQHPQAQIVIGNPNYQMLPPTNIYAKPDNAGFSAATSKNVNVTKGTDNISENSKNSRRRRNGKQLKSTKENKDDDDDENGNKATTSKAPGIPHLAHSMKKKNQNTGKINKANLTINEIKVVTSVQEKSETLGTMQTTMTSSMPPPRHTQQPKTSSSNPKVSPRNSPLPTTQEQQIQSNVKSNGPKDSSKTQGIAEHTLQAQQQQSKVKADGSTNSSMNHVDQQNQSLSNKKNPSKPSTPKVIASIPPMSFASGAAKAQTTASDTQYSVSSLNRPSTVANVKTPTLNQLSDNETVSRTVDSQYSSTVLNRATATVNVTPPLSQTTIANRTSSSQLDGASGNSQYSSSSLNRTAAVVNIYPTLNPTRSNTSYGQTTGTTTTTGNVPNLPRAANITFNNEERIPTVNSSNSYTRTNSIQTGAEAFNFNQPHRPVRNLEFREQKKKDCVIA